MQLVYLEWLANCAYLLTLLLWPEAFAIGLLLIFLANSSLSGLAFKLLIGLLGLARFAYRKSAGI